jgi:hypothetical protein
MPILMLINSETVKDGLQYLNDVVGVFPDDHQFSGTELAKFNFLSVGIGINTVDEVKARIRQITPAIEDAFLWQSDNKYHWTDPDGETIIGRMRVFQVEGSNRWYELVSDFKFPANTGDLTPEEKQLLETVDVTHPSVDSFIRKLVKDITVLTGNTNEIKDLRNSQP